MKTRAYLLIAVFLVVSIAAFAIPVLINRTLYPSAERLDMMGLTFTSSPTSTSSLTSTATDTATPTATWTFTPSSTSTLTPTVTRTPTMTATVTPSRTLIPPTNTRRAGQQQNTQVPSQPDNPQPTNPPPANPPATSPPPVILPLPLPLPTLPPLF